MDVTNLPPKDILDVKIKGDQLLIISRLTFGDTDIESKLYYDRYKGNIPPDSWLE